MMNIIVLSKDYCFFYVTLTILLIILVKRRSIINPSLKIYKLTLISSQVTFERFAITPPFQSSH